jgi:hypothetical protein
MCFLTNNPSITSPTPSFLVNPRGINQKHTDRQNKKYEKENIYFTVTPFSAIIFDGRQY